MVSNMKDRSVNGDISEGNQHALYLQAARQLIQDGQSFEDDIFNLVDILSQVLCDQIPENRKLAMDLLCELIPSYKGDDLDVNIGLLFPQLLQNLLHHQLNVKKSVLQVLHVYYRHTRDVSQSLDHLIKHGINTDLKAVRNEVLVSIPALMSTGFAATHLDKLVISIINCLNLIGDGESILPVTLCLEHLRNIMGENEFDVILDQLDPSLSNLYHAVVENPTYTWDSSHKQKTSNHMADVVPIEILQNLDSEKSWQTRSDAINDLFTFVSQTIDGRSLVYYCRRILDYISVLVDDANFNVALVSMNILHQIIIRTGGQVKVHLDLVIQILLKKLSDGKLIMRKINLRIALSLMHSLSPMVFLKSIFPILKNKSSRVREEIINMIIAALLSFPSSEFNLALLPDIIAFTLLDNRKRVRHASLECFAILAQQLGPGNLSSLVSAVDILERKNKNAEGLLLAVQSRLGRKMLPKINENELVQYAVKLPTSKSTDGQLKPDVAWIISGMSVSGYESCRSEMSEYNDSGDKRILSAGRNKLPWQENGNQKLSTRKNAASAPVRSMGLNQSRSPEEPSPVICDSWVVDPSSEKRVPANGSNMPVSYFELYKNKMKKLKEAGLRADVQTVNMEFASNEKITSNKEDILSPFEDDSFDDSITETKTSPVPVKPTLARSASKKRKDRALTDRKASDDIYTRNGKDLTNLYDANLAHTLPKMKGGLRHLISETAGPSSIPPQNQNPPFPMRRATIHRTPSGTARSSPRMAEISNLTRLKPLSKSSPETQPLNTAHLQNGSSTQYAEDSQYDRRNSNAREYKEETRRQSHRRNSTDRRYAEDVQRGSQLRNGDDHQRNGDIAYTRTTFDNHSQHDKNVSNNKETQPGTPKLAKSAQEKMRKLKEEQQRLSANKHRNEPSSGTNAAFPHKLNLELNNNHRDHVMERNAKPQFQESPFAKKGNKLRHSNSFTSQTSPVSPQLPYHGGSPNEIIKSPLSPLSDRLPFHPDDRPIKPAKQQYWGNRNGDVTHSPNEAPVTNGDERPIKSSKQQYWGDGNGESTSAFNSVDGLHIEGHKPKVQKVQPKIGSSPKVKRKTNRKSLPHQGADDKENMMESSPKPNKNGYEANKTDVQNMKSSETVTVALEMLNSSPEEWESKIDGLDLTLNLVKREGDDICEGHAVITAILTQVKNLRSQITRKALNCIGQVFVHAPRTCEPDLEAILKTVLPKAGDTNQFIKSDTEQAIELLVENVNPYKAMAALVSCGVAHLNGHVRKISAKALADITERVGYAKFCSQRGYLMAAAKLAQDQHPESRYHGRRIMLQLLDYPDLMESLKRQLKPANFKAVHDIIENLKVRGLEPAAGSATLRRSMRGSAPYNSPSTTRSRKR